jgi:NitT/TauT family transport system substrate-binding protein
MRWPVPAFVGALLAVAASGASSAVGDDQIRVATLKTGTLAWELDTLRAHGLDRDADSQSKPQSLRAPKPERSP